MPLWHGLCAGGLSISASGFFPNIEWVIGTCQMSHRYESVKEPNSFRRLDNCRRAQWIGRSNSARRAKTAQILAR